MAVYGNVNVKYAPCKSAAQLHSAADYILGKKKEQLSSGVIKTKSELYNAFGCNRDNFANSVLMTRKMHQKKYSRFSLFLPSKKSYLIVRIGSPCGS